MDPRHYEMSEKEILIEQMKLQKETNRRLKTMIILFWIFYGIPLILGGLFLFLGVFIGL
jgi:hypothetical protein